MQINRTESICPICISLSDLVLIHPITNFLVSIWGLMFFTLIARQTKPVLKYNAGTEYKIRIEKHVIHCNPTITINFHNTFGVTNLCLPHFQTDNYHQFHLKMVTG